MADRRCSLGNLHRGAGIFHDLGMTLVCKFVIEADRYVRNTERRYRLFDKPLKQIDRLLAWRVKLKRAHRKSRYHLTNAFQKSIAVGHCHNLFLLFIKSHLQR
jgi:hypothetical protein